jgi:gliding motility-associated protein GldE
LDPEPLSLYYLFISIEPIIGLKIVLLAFLLICSALISGAEVAFFSLTPSVIEEQKEAYPKKILKIENLLKKPKRLLATILVANNFINIGMVLLFASLGDLIFGDVVNEFVRLFIEIGLITFIILLFGEILPKIYANKNSMIFSRFMVGIIYFLDRKLLFFITYPMSSVTLFLERNFGQKSNTFSVNTLSQALEFTEQKDTTKQEDQILQGIINFGATDTKQVMCPRIDVFALDKEMTFEEILPLIIEKGFSRIPVYKDKMDQIDGILYVKDLMPNISTPNFKWQDLLREPYYVPENKKLDDLLNEFKVKKMHKAVVVDEYGVTSGIVTLEDLIEEIVGDISDEFDEEELEFSRVDAKNFIINAKVSLKDFYRIIDLEDFEGFEKAKGEAETLAGFILEIAQQLPVFGQKIEFENLLFKVELVDKKRIKQIKVTLP